MSAPPLYDTLTSVQSIFPVPDIIGLVSTIVDQLTGVVIAIIGGVAAYHKRTSLFLDTQLNPVNPHQTKIWPFGCSYNE